MHSPPPTPHHDTRPTYVHTDFKHSDPFPFILPASSAQSAGRAHCSSRPISHGAPTAANGRHPLPSSGQNAPRGHSGGMGTVVLANPKGNSSRLHWRGWHVPVPTPAPVPFALAVGAQKEVSSQSLENRPVVASRWSCAGVHAVARVDVAEAWGARESARTSARGLMVECSVLHG